MSATIVENKSKSILVVDNETNMRTTLSDILIGQGYDVTTATTGEEAVGLSEQNGYDIILMDVRMPGINGVEAFQQIRKLRTQPRVIMMSAFSVDDLKNTALEAGALAFLPKPLDVDQFVRLIREAKDTAILIVEDDPRLARTLQEQMKREGYRVTITNSPQDALELVEQIRFDLFIIEAKLPIMNGLDLFMAIRKISPSAVAVLLADEGESGRQLHDDAVRRGIYAMLPKPLVPEQLISLIDRITRERASGELNRSSGIYSATTIVSPA